MPGPSATIEPFTLGRPLYLRWGYFISIHFPFVSDLPRLFAYVFKVIWQSISLFFFLVFKRRSHYVFIQTPPAIPVLAIAWFYSLLVAAKMVIDWHNYAYSLMALTLGENSFIVRCSYWFECYFGLKARYNICVTNAMRQDLIERWGIV